MKSISKFIEQRAKLYTQLQQKRKLELTQQQHSKIKVQIGESIRDVEMNITTPFQLLRYVEEKDKENPIILAKVRYEEKANIEKLVDTDQIEEDSNQENEQWELYDLNRPLKGNCELQFIKFDENKSIFWHSSTHILGSVIEQVYPDSLLTFGPPIKEGFFYDFYPSNEKVVHESDYDQIQKVYEDIVQQKYLYERLLITKDEALEMFSYNKFKSYLIQTKVPDNSMTSVYKIGQFIDLCTGPHIPSTAYTKGFAVVKHSSAYWLGDSQNESLQRLYGISFPTKQQVINWQILQKEKHQRDHRIIGQKQNLYFFDKLSPGSAFFLHNGTKIYNRLMEFLRYQYTVRGYQEVITPNMFHIDLWKISGHYKNYKENLFLIKHQHHDQHCSHQYETFGLKPMNCPGHCLMFRHEIHSYKELPIRMADFGVLHRNEISGALSGLTRVRRFQQDDAHIFCRKDQIEQEVKGCLDFLSAVYGLFGFKWQIYLSTRPTSSMGSDELWEEAEQQLKAALEKHQPKQWKIRKGDGAFYGPKIDIVVYDAMEREQQCGTIQLDFQLPIRFNLQYKTSENVNEDQQIEHQDLQEEIYPPDEFSQEQFIWKEQPLKHGYERPVMVHRAILGSLERFIAILGEHLQGKWPLWLSPRQVMICVVSDAYLEYGQQVYQKLKEQGFQVELDDTKASINKKVRSATILAYNIIVVVGEKELQDNAVDIRTREGERLGKMEISNFIQYLNSQYPEGVPLPCKQFNHKYNLLSSKQ